MKDFNFDYPFNEGRKLFGTLHVSGYYNSNGKAIVCEVQYTDEIAKVSADKFRVYYQPCDITALVQEKCTPLWKELEQAAQHHVDEMYGDAIKIHPVYETIKKTFGN